MIVRCKDMLLRKFGYREVTDPDNQFEQYNVISLVCSHCEEAVCYTVLDKEKERVAMFQHICKESL